MLTPADADTARAVPAAIRNVVLVGRLHDDVVTRIPAQDAVRACVSRHDRDIDAGGDVPTDADGPAMAR
jgi:hypothetical protein